MQTKVFDMAGKQVGEIELSEAIFGIELWEMAYRAAVVCLSS